MKRRFVITAAICLTLCVGVVLAVAGTSSDPLISLEYLTDTFLPSLLSQAKEQTDTALSSSYAETQQQLNDIQAQFSGEDGTWSTSGTFQSAEYQKGDQVDVTEGSGLLFLEGAASAVPSQGEIIDVTDGTSSGDAVSLTPDHRYLAGEDAAVTVTIRSETAFLCVVGQYAVRDSGETALPFTDVTDTDWYYESVQYAYEHGLFNGIDTHHFAPTNAMTRSMLATVLYRVAGEPSAEGLSNPFSDVAAGAWYETAVTWASSAGVVSGVSASDFAPNTSVTREQLATMLYRYAAVQDGANPSAAGDLSAFSDSGKISSWAGDAMSWAVGKGIITGKSGGILDPGGNASRAEVATMIGRFLNLDA